MTQGERTNGALNSQELARYSRHILLEEIGVEGQRRLKRSKVLVIGAGGLGSPAAMYLAAAGVGELGVADFDKVELHNLQRQLLHGTGDIDRPKGESARDRLNALNPHVKVRLHPRGLLPDNALELYGRYDLVVDGADNFGTRYLNNDAAYFAKKPLVYGSIFKFEGQVCLFDTARGTPCYRCLFPEPPPPGAVPNCGEAGVFGALCGVVGSLQALEAIKRLTGAGEPLASSLLIIETLRMRLRRLNVARDPACPLCGKRPAIRGIDPAAYGEACQPGVSASTDKAMDNSSEIPMEIDVEEAKRRIERDGAVLIDVREPYERDICAIGGAWPIPLDDIGERLDQLPRDRELLLHCHHGGRSLRATKFLREKGFARAVNVAGGIHAWSERIDPSLQKY